MKSSLCISTCTGFALFFLACHMFAIIDAEQSQESSDNIATLGESRIGPPHRQKRYQETLTITTSNQADGNDQENGREYESGQYESDDDENYESNDEDDDDDEDYDNESSLLQKNLDMLQKTSKTLGRYVRDDSNLDKFMSESSELAKEVGTVFRQLVKREAGMEDEMENLKKALNETIMTLWNTLQEEERAQKLAKANESNADGDSGKIDQENGEKQNSRVRRHNYQRNPYRACVEIEPISYDYSRGNYDSTKQAMSSQSFEQAKVGVREYLPSEGGSSYSSSFESGGTGVNSQKNADYSQEKYYSQSQSQQYQPPPDYIPRPLPMMPLQGRELISSEKKVEIQSVGQKSGQQQSQIRSSKTMQVKGASNYNQQSSQSQNYNQQRQVGNLMDNQFSRGGTNDQSSQYYNSNTYKSGVKSGSSQSQSSQYQNSKNGNNAQSHMNDVDLSDVYWLRLDPERSQDLLKKRLDDVLRQKQSEGKDVLVIPMVHGLHDTEEVKNGFLRSVRVRPPALGKKPFRKLRSLAVKEL